MTFLACFLSVSIAVGSGARKKKTEARSNSAAALRVFKHFLGQHSQTAFVYWHCTDGIHFLKNDQANMSVSFSEFALFVWLVNLDSHVLLKTDPKSAKPFTSLLCTIWNTGLLFRPSPGQEEQLVWFNPSLHDLRWRSRMHNVALYFIPLPAIVHHECLFFLNPPPISLLLPFTTSSVPYRSQKYRSGGRGAFRRRIFHAYRVSRGSDGGISNNRHGWSSQRVDYQMRNRISYNGQVKELSPRV